MKKEKIILIGGGGHCKSCIDVIEMQNKYEIIGIVDVKENIKNFILDYQILHVDADLPKLIKDCSNFLITIGHIRNPEKRIYFYKEIKKLGGNFPIVISPLAYVSKHSKIGEGTIIMHNVVVNAEAEIGVNSIINTKALIEHDAKIGNHCHISTGSIVNGGVNIEDFTFYGSGAVSKQSITIPSNSFIKANSIVK